MSKKKTTKPKPIPFEDVDIARKTIDWLLTQASEVQAQLQPHKTKRGLIAATNKAGDHVCIMFKGNVEDLFKVKEFIDGLDEK